MYKDEIGESNKGKAFEGIDEGAQQAAKHRIETYIT